MCNGDDPAGAGKNLDRPLLKPWYRIAERGGDVLFQYGRSLVAFRGPGADTLLRRLLPLLDGTRDVEVIAEGFVPRERPAVYRALELMRDRDLLLDGPMDVNDKNGAVMAARFLGAALGQTAHPSRFAAAIQKSVIGIVGSSTTASIMRELVSGSGGQAWTLTPDGGVPQAVGKLTMLVAAPDARETASLSAINRACLAERVPWTQVLPFDGEVAVIGPVYVPWQTCCYECFRLRRLANSPLGGHLTAFDDENNSWPTALPVEHMLAGMASMVVLRWLLGPEVERPGRAFTFRIGPTMSFEVHTIYRVPRCPACSPGVPLAAESSQLSTGNAGASGPLPN